MPNSFHTLPGKDDTLGISSWAKKAVEKIWINELTDTMLFAEYQKSITREEFASLAVRLYEKATGNVIKVKCNQPFTDLRFIIKLLSNITKKQHTRFTTESSMLLLY